MNISIRKGVCFLYFLVIYSTFSQDFNIFDTIPKRGMELNNPKLKIGAFSSKNSKPFYLVELEKNQGILDQYNSQEWKEIKLPFEFKKIKANSKLIALSLLFEFELKNLPFNYEKDQITLHIPFFTVNLELFLNGEKIAEIGKTNLKEQKYISYGFRRHTIINIPKELLKEKNELVLVLFSIYPDNIRFDKFLSDIPLELNIYKEHIKIHTENLLFMFLFLYLFVGLYHFLLFMKRPKERYNFWFALFSIFISIYYFTRSNYIYVFGSHYNLDSFLITKIEYSIIFLSSLWGIFFYEEFHFHKITIFSKILSFLILFYTTIIWFFSYYFCSVILGYWQKTTLIIILYTLGIVVYYSFKKNQDSLRLLIGMVVFAITVTLDILGAMGIGLQNYQLTRYGFFVFLIGIAFVLANKFLRVYKEIEELNLHLEEKVRERTRELQISLEQIQKLKEQQDGDYFLTSLLIQPLIYINVNSELIQIDYILKQKKEFQFRKWQREIGGDIVIAQSLRLKDKPYVFVFNGDAMGKSLQGAGGALVAGVVIKAILTRTLLYPENQNKYPEKWLKELFIELHKVFESFDGSMLLSGYLGLIDEISGILYYIYAEHPYPVLYRNQKAEFLDTMSNFKKFGTPGLLGKIFIKFVNLQPEDIIFIGSDGKDDLILQNNGKEIINEDETLFLRIVEDSKGELKSILDNIQKVGKLIDDVSIVKIFYRKEATNEKDKIEEQFSEEIRAQIFDYKQQKNYIELKNFLEEINQKVHNSSWITRELLITYFKLEYYSEFISEAESYLEVYPDDNEILFFLERAYMHIRNYEKALEIAERLDLRDPMDVLNLITLTDCYRLLGNKKKAIKSLNRLLDIAPEREEVKKLRKILLNY